MSPPQAGRTADWGERLAATGLQRQSGTVRRVTVSAVEIEHRGTVKVLWAGKPRPEPQSRTQ
jgi:hypothetical protein